MASGTGWQADVARGTIALMRRGTEATWQGSGWPARGAGGAKGTDTWQEATRVHVAARVGCHMAGEVGRWRAHGIVGLGKILGVVTRKCYTAPQFKLAILYDLFHVGLCPHENLPLQEAWTHQNRQ